MKFRYVIERAVDTISGEPGYVVSEATANDPSYRVGSWTHDTIDDAKATAERSAASFDPDATLTWKDPPQSWLPDVVCVSQYVDDGVEANRDD